MRIHLIQPNDIDHQSLMTGGVMVDELWPNYLLSYEYRRFEQAYDRVWSRLVNHVESTRDL